MRDVNEIVGRNARAFIEKAKKGAAQEDREITEFTIAGRMAKVMGMKQRSVDTQLRRQLRGTAVWRMDYVQGLAGALGRDTREFFSLDESKQTPEATVAQSLYTGLNHRITPREVRGLVRRLHRLLDHKPLYDLAQTIIDKLSDATGKDEAFRSVHNLIEKSAAWDTKGANLRGRKIIDTKST